MKLRRRRRVKAFPQKRSQLGGSGLPPRIWVQGFASPVRLAGQRLRRRPDKCDAGCRRHKLHITHFRRCRRRKLAHSAAPPSSRRNPAKRFRREPCWGGDKNSRFAFFRRFYAGGWYHYPRRALHAVETLDARGSRRRIRRFYAAPEFAPCGLNIPSAGTHATPAPNRAHSGSHAETRRVLRVDGDDVFGSGIIDTIGPFQADQPISVALAEEHRNAVSP